MFLHKRENKTYENMSVDLSHSEMIVRFKNCKVMTSKYEEGNKRGMPFDSLEDGMPQSVQT